MAEAVRVPRKARAKSRPKVGVGRGRGGRPGRSPGLSFRPPGAGGASAQRRVCHRRLSFVAVPGSLGLWSRDQAPICVTLVVFFFLLVSFCFKAAGRVAALGGVYVHPLLLEAVRLGAGVGTLF